MSCGKTAFYCILGTALEWYDFAVFGVLAPTIAKLFFPYTNPIISLLLSFSVFAVAFVTRPFGALFFGWMGDIIGRKKTLFYSLMLMMLSTVAIGLLPTYKDIGVLAPLFLLMLRILQGISLGGEYTGAITYLGEIAPIGKSGFYQSFVFVSVAGGFFLGNFSNFFALYFINSSNAWRFPFLASAVLSIIAFYLRYKALESPLFSVLLKCKTVVTNPVKEVFKKYFFNVLLLIGVFCECSVIFYTQLIYMPTYFLNDRFLTKYSWFLNMLGIIIFAFFIPIFGAFSDRLGKKLVFMIGSSCFFIFSYFIFLGFASHNLTIVVISQIIFSLLMGLCLAPVPAIASNLFPIGVRCTGVSLGVNISNAIFGGTAPFVATLLVYLTQKNISVSFYLILSSFIGLVSAWYIKDSKYM